MDENQISNLDLLSSFLVTRYENENNTGNIIYNGMTDKLEEFGQSIGDTDIGQIRYFNEPVQMYDPRRNTCMFQNEIFK